MKIIDSFASPNFGERITDKIDMLVFHYTAMEDAKSAIERLCDPKAQVSSHYLISKRGEIYRLVDESKRAWHAGRSAWRGVTDINSQSIGIELDNLGLDGDGEFIAFAEPQLEALLWLSRDIMSRHDLSARNIVGHSDIAFMRKQDPGNKFPWQRFAEQGIGVWPNPVSTPSRATKPIGPASQPADIDMFRGKLNAYGYAVSTSGAYDNDLRGAIIAFQRHFDPQHVNGVADDRLQAILDDILTQIDG